MLDCGFTPPARPVPLAAAAWATAAAALSKPTWAAYSIVSPDGMFSCSGTDVADHELALRQGEHEPGAVRLDEGVGRSTRLGLDDVGRCGAEARADQAAEHDALGPEVRVRAAFQLAIP